MSLIWPWSLLALVPLLAAALWALFRPARRRVVVGSLALWQEAAAELRASPRRRSRRADLAWVLLLAGGVAACLALARPVHGLARPGRAIAIQIKPSAELAEETWRASARALLDRLDPGDRVRISAPAILGGAGPWQTPEQARRDLSRIRRLPVSAGRLSLPPAEPDAQHVYRLVPAGGEDASGPATTIVGLPSSLPAATIDAAGAELLQGDEVVLLVAVRGHVPEPLGIQVVVKSVSDEGEPTGAATIPLEVPPGGREEVLRRFPAAAAFAIHLRRDGEEGAGWGAEGYLARREAASRTVAMVGRDEPLVRRYVGADPALELVGDPNDADLVIAIGELPPERIPALVIDPPSPPAGWREAEPVRRVDLGAASVAADDPILRGVDLAGVAVLRARRWLAPGRTGQRTVVSLEDGALVLRSRERAAGGPRKVWLSLDVSAANTNFALSEALVVFLANTTRWLAPRDRGPDRYEFVAPIEAEDGWSRLNGRSQPGPVPEPGLYRDEAGALRAVTLAGLESASPKTPPDRAVAEVPLPAPRAVGRRVELWPYLAGGAMMLWLAGWALAARRRISGAVTASLARP